MSFVKILLSVPDSAATMNSTYLQLNTAAQQVSGIGMVNLISDMIEGSQLSYTKVSTGAVQATATMTSTGAAVNNETALVANVTLTAKTSGAVAANGEFNLSATPTTQATNIAAAINAVAGLSGIVTATSALGVVTITAVQPGKTGNGLQISEGLTNVTATAFSGGSDGSQVAVNYGRAS
jgi:hypothetical protein